MSYQINYSGYLTSNEITLFKSRLIELYNELSKNENQWNSNIDGVTPVRGEIREWKNETIKGKLLISKSLIKAPDFVPISKKASADFDEFIKTMKQHYESKYKEITKEKYSEKTATLNLFNDAMSKEDKRDRLNISFYEQKFENDLSNLKSNFLIVDEVSVDGFQFNFLSDRETNTIGGVILNSITKTGANVKLLNNICRITAVTGDFNNELLNQFDFILENGYSYIYKYHFPKILKEFILKNEREFEDFRVVQ